MPAKNGTRWIVLYAVVATGLLALTTVTHGAVKPQRFDEIVVHRIKVVEPDGILRMAIHSQASSCKEKSRGPITDLVRACCSITTKERRTAV